VVPPCGIVFNWLIYCIMVKRLIIILSQTSNGAYPVISPYEDKILKRILSSVVPPCGIVFNWLIYCIMVKRLIIILSQTSNGAYRKLTIKFLIHHH